jgi:hypothetical protein
MGPVAEDPLERDSALSLDIGRADRDHESLAARLRAQITVDTAFIMCTTSSHERQR